MKTGFRRSGFLVGLLLALSMNLSCAGTDAEPPRVDAPVSSRSSSVFQGFPSQGDPAVFAILISKGNQGFLCTATLIGQRTLLTAAHCVVRADSIVATNQLLVFDPVTQIFAGDLVFIPAYTWLADPLYDRTTITNDVALVALEQIPYVAPKGWNSAAIDNLPNGSPIHLVGYGDSRVDASGNTGAGLKRTGNAALKEVDGTQIQLSLSDASTCFGDSGGPSFYTFPDGVERQVGITSFGDAVCGSMDVATRVDAFADFIQSTLTQFDPPNCGADGQCVPGCMPEDVDCTCAADGVCNPSCPDQSTDPDCAAACTNNGVCARVACTTPDVDCQPNGHACLTDAECAGALCVVDAQHQEAYCSQSCSGDNDCSGGYSCQASACRHVALPEVAPGTACTPGSQFCTQGTVCARPVDGGVVECRVPCGKDSDCPAQQHCAGDPDATYCDAVVAVITPPVTPPPTTPSKGGCSSAGGLSAVWMGLLSAAWLSGLRRRAVR